jgi:hypothetical protein
MEPQSDPGHLRASANPQGPASADPLDHARVAYERLQAAQERYWTLLQMALRGETYSPNKLATAAHEVRARQQEFLAVGDFLLPRPRARK